jgi:ectoine hydroxylase-related dioxygenase (phytanoyl-CoA dioxygenase family)
LAFRLIRPNRGDGYPYSCKDWGPAKGIISVWIPILGFSKTQILSVVPGSHLKTYASYLPVDGIHMKNEYRLLEPLALELTDRPVLQPGEAIVFHSKTIHSEDVIEGDETRLNLEFRLLPQ